jgi:NADH-quinone oxidoreductase subunit N
VALTYGATGTTTLTGISFFLSASRHLCTVASSWAGIALLVVGFAFKVAAVPFHLWSPDVYDGAPTPGDGLHGRHREDRRPSPPSCASSCRPSEPSSRRGDRFWPCSFCSRPSSAPSLAIQQRNIKRLLAYSSINHAGFILLGLWAGTVHGAAGTLYYVATYAPLAIASFAIVALVAGRGDARHDVENYRGLARRQPWLGGALAVVLLAQSGAPFTTGFLAKFSVVSAAVSAGGAWFGVAVMLAAAIAAFFYLRLTLSLYADGDDDGARRERSVGRVAS